MEQIPGQMDIESFISIPPKKEFHILNIIPVGSKNAIKRSWLCFVTKMADRTMRILLHEARMKIPGMNLQNGKGYFIPDMNCVEDQKLLVRWVRQEKSRIKELAVIVGIAEKTLKNCGIEIEEEKEWRDG